MTHKPSTNACVDNDPSLSRSSSEMVPPDAGPVAIVRWTNILDIDDDAAYRRKVEDSMVLSYRY
jgi:hypothetical protein